jgi:MFS family permease
VGAAGASGGALGALLGGLITSSLGWSWTFFVNVPIAGLAGIAALWLLPKDEPAQTRGPIDVPGALLITGGATMLVVSCIEGPQLGWLTPSVLDLFAGSAALIAAFLFIEARTAAPLMPLRLLHHPTLSPAILITGLFGAAFGAQYFLLTTYLQEVRHHAPSVAGWSFLPFALAIVAGTEAPRRGSLGCPSCQKDSRANAQSVFPLPPLRVRVWAGSAATG